jgi:photosystem II stability/assembly factor-like uncharacterized protein
MKRWAWVTIFAAGMIGGAGVIGDATAQGADDGSSWKAVNGKWEGGSNAAIWTMTAWPGKDEVIASTRGNGLWSTTDHGETWKRMGEPGKSPPNSGEANQFVFDPKDSNTMWTSGMYNYGVWKTADGGKTFTHLSKNNHVDGFAVDFSDPARKLQLMGLHEQEHSVHESTDGGATWIKIGDKIPAQAFTTNPIILDTKTWIIDSAGYKQGEQWGIFRTEDGGENWTNVSKEGASGSPTITSKGTIFWFVLWDQKIIKSTDQGKTWERVNGAPRGNVIEIRPDRLVALGGNRKAQLYVSKDDGKTWTPFGDPLPFKGHGFTYDAVGKCFFAWPERNGNGPLNDGEIVRWDLPADFDSAFNQKSTDQTVWDGEGYADGNGWISPAGKNTFRMSSKEHYNGKQSLEYHVEDSASSSGGWNWANWQMSGVTDLSGFERLSFYVKLTGDKPTQVQASLACGPNKLASANVDLAKYAPDYADGQWHLVSVPLKDLYAGNQFDPKAVYELRFLTTEPKDSKFNMYVDVVRFLKRRN